MNAFLIKEVAMNEVARWNPFEDSAFSLIPTLLRPVARRSGWSGPTMDVIDTDSAYRLVVDLPGVKKEAIQVSVFENTVTVSAELAEENGGNAEGEEQGWLLRERQFGRFSRSIALPEAVDETASEARYAD